MGNILFPKKDTGYRYNVYGIQYLEAKDKKETRTTTTVETEQNGCIPNINKHLTIPGVNRKQDALYVSNDWTENIFDKESLADVDWMDPNCYPYENLVMSGGGSKGYAFIGALKALEDAGILQNIRRVAGSSAGAICAGLIAVGCSPQEVADLFTGDVKWLFQDQMCAECCCLPKLFKTYGVHPAKRFYKIYGQHLERKTGNPDITFGEVKEKHGRELCVVVTNLSKMCSEYCTPENTPTLPVRTAVRMSMSFPMVYEAVKYEINGEVSLYTDGGTLDQYPVHCFDDKSLDLNHNHNSKMASLRGRVNKKTIGLYVVSECAIDYKIWSALFGCKMPYKPTYLPDTKLARSRLLQEYEKRKHRSKEFTFKEFLAELRADETKHEEPMFHYETCNKSMVDIRNFKDYFVTTIETLLISQRKLHIKPYDAQRTVAVNCGYIGTNDYVIEPEDREFMIRQGYEHTRQFLKEFIQKSKGDFRLDASLTSQTIREVSPSREIYHSVSDDVTAAGDFDRILNMNEHITAVTSHNLTESSIRYMDETFGSCDNLERQVELLKSVLPVDTVAAACVTSRDVDSACVTSRDVDSSCVTSRDVDSSCKSERHDEINTVQSITEPRVRVGPNDSISGLSSSISKVSDSGMTSQKQHNESLSSTNGIECIDTSHRKSSKVKVKLSGTEASPFVQHTRTPQAPLTQTASHQIQSVTRTRPNNAAATKRKHFATSRSSSDVQNFLTSSSKDNQFSFLFNPSEHSTDSLHPIVKRHINQPISDDEQDAILNRHQHYQTAKQNTAATLPNQSHGLQTTRVMSRDHRRPMKSLSCVEVLNRYQFGTDSKPPAVRKSFSAVETTV